MKVLRSASALALVLASVLIGLVIGAPAAQATSTGWVQANLALDLSVSPDVECWANFRMTTLGSVSVIEEAPDGRCDGGPNMGPGCAQIGEIGCTELTWTFNGEGCGSGVVLSPPLSEHPDSGLSSVKMTLGAYQAVADDCDPVEVCLWAKATTWGNDQEAESCAPVALDPPADEASACAFGNVTSANLETSHDMYKYGDAAAGNTKWFWKTFRASVTGGGSGTWATYMLFENGTRASEPLWMTAPSVEGPPYLSEWHNYRSINGAAGSGNTALITSGNHRISASRGTDADAKIGGTTVQTIVGSGPPDPVALGWSTREVIGIGAFRVESWASSTDGSGIQTGLWALGQSANPGGSLDTGVVGMNNPARCAFYFGEKVWNNSTLTVDEPAGTFTTDEVEDDGDPPPIPVDDDDPDTDLGWLAAIWAMLKAIWGTLQGLASSIASAIASALSGLGQFILDGIEALFVPADGFDPYFTDIKQSWRDSAPGAFILGFTDMGVTWPSSGCGGIPVNFSMYSTNVNFNLGAACSGASASAAATVKLVASAGVVVGGGLAAVRAIGSGFGWSPGIGRGGHES